MSKEDCLGVYEDAVFYDLEFAERKQDLAFYLKWARPTEKGKVLELACGTGRIMIPLCLMGTEVIGLDLSLPMLEQAMKKSESLRLSIEWAHQDAADFRLPSRFDRIFMATNALQHLVELPHLQSFFSSIHRHLNPNGLFIFDVFNPNLSKLLRKPDERYLHKTFKDLENRQIRVEACSEYDPVRQIFSFELFYLEPGGECFKTKRVKMRCFFPQELSLLCRSNGLEIVHQFGDYDESPFRAGSPKQIIVCRPVSGRE
ncbi:MAG: class I SAM-dependent methyltransferase [bacterium]